MEAKRHMLAGIERLEQGDWPTALRHFERAIEILSSQVNRTMRLLGVTSLDELAPRHVTQLHRFARGES